MKLKKQRAYVRGTITSTLNQLKEMFDPGTTASPSESLVLSLIFDVEEKLKTVDEFTSEICFELDDELMQEEVENNSKFVLSVKTQICMFYFPALALQATMHSCTRQKGRKDSDGRVQDAGLRIPEYLQTNTDKYNGMRGQ